MFSQVTNNSSSHTIVTTTLPDQYQTNNLDYFDLRPPSYSTQLPRNPNREVTKIFDDDDRDVLGGSFVQTANLLRLNPHFFPVIETS